MADSIRAGRMRLDLDQHDLQRLVDAIQCSKPVCGLTHDFYRYPARFSPQFARTVIELFTEPGDVVVDPFMGGATSLVEARALGRVGIGLDVNELSCFIARVKTTPLAPSDIKAIHSWIRHTIPILNMRLTAKRPHEWIARGYQRNIGTRQTWPIRKSLEQALARVTLLKSEVQKDFIRAVLLRTGQWALDCRSDVPTAMQFRERLQQFSAEMINAIGEYARILNSNRDVLSHDQIPSPTIILHRSAETIDSEPSLRVYDAPKLVLTSPPYPGVHVLYHRWQVLGRRETAAPYWIAESSDGQGASHYTFCGRRRQDRAEVYFRRLQSCFASVRKVVDDDCVVAQLVGFAHPDHQLPLYLDAMA